MKKSLCIAVAVLMAALPLGMALAETDGQAVTLSGRVEAGETITVAAPYGGLLGDYTLRAGDIVSEGDALFTIGTTKVYAPTDGTVRGVFARAGDDAAYVEGRYGALLTIEPDVQFVVQSDTSGAYDSEGRAVHAGETVYLASVNSTKRDGTGRITAVSGKAFTVEVTEGTLELDESVTIHRKADHDTESRIGRGKTDRPDPVTVSGQGGVLRVRVEDGETVRRGDVLLETVNGTLLGKVDMTDAVAAPASAVVASVPAAPGAQVAADQPLATLYPLDGYRVAADINENDLPLVAAGDTVQLEISGLTDTSAVPGTVTAISGLNHAASGEAVYKVYVALDADKEVREGMSVTVRLKGK